MSESYIQLPPDGTGKRIRSVVKTVGGVEVHEEIHGLDRFPKRNILGKYIAVTPMISGSTTSGYVYASMMNPPGSGIYVAIRRLRPLVFAVAAAVYIQISVFRITSHSGGTLLDVSAICKKDTAFPNPKAEIRHTGPTVTSTGARVVSYVSPGAAGLVHFLGGMVDYGDYDELILRPGEGIALIQEAAGDADFRIIFHVEWDEFTGDIWL